MTQDLIRPARSDEVDALNRLISTSATALSKGYYTEPETESLIRHVFGVDTQLIADGTYYVIERDGRPVACGGWSARETLFGGDQSKSPDDALLDPRRASARIRAFFVHPEAARQGLGRLLLSHCEGAAREAGFQRFELMATLPGVPLYRAAGYRPKETRAHPLPDGVTVELVRMEK